MTSWETLDQLALEDSSLELFVMLPLSFPHSLTLFFFFFGVNQDELDTCQLKLTKGV